MLQTKDLLGRDLHLGDTVFQPRFVSSNYSTFDVLMIVHESPKSLKLLHIGDMTQRTGKYYPRNNGYSLTTTRAVCLVPIRIDKKQVLQDRLKLNVGGLSKTCIKQIETFIKEL